MRKLYVAAGLPSVRAVCSLGDLVVRQTLRLEVPVGVETAHQNDLVGFRHSLRESASARMSRTKGVSLFRSGLSVCVMVIACAALLGAGAQGIRAGEASVRPSAVAACNAWRVHIGDLIDQHRIAQELDECTLSDIVRRFITARNACTPGRYELGLRMYEEIPIGPVQGRTLR